MNQAKKVERSHRFKTAVKISLPFIIMVSFLSYIFFKNNDINSDDIILFTILTLCYVYFTTYMIYQSFKSSVIDSASEVFNRQKILEILRKKIKNSDEKNSLVLLNFKNISDITDRYGFDFGDEIIRDSLEILRKILITNNIKDITIGRYSDRYFLLFLPAQKRYITHIFTIFSKNIQSEGIKSVEVVIEFAAIPANHSKNVKTSINFLSNELNGSTYNYDDLDKYESDICKNISDGNFIFKIQKIASLNSNDNLYLVIPTLKTKYFGNIARSSFTTIANKNGYEITLYKQIFTLFLSKIRDNKDTKFIIDISAVTIRNNEFLNFLKDYIKEYKINPNNIIFEFNEVEKYTHLSRFNELIREYKNIGFSIAINHFGGKDSLLSYFLNLDIDYIIYDIFFSKNYRDKKVANTFLKFNEICSSLGIKSIMKFVERAEILEFAKINKVDFVQGFYIQKPIEI